MSPGSEIPIRSRLLAVTFLVPVLLIGALAWVSYRAASESVSAFNEVNHSHAVIHELQTALESLTDAETSQRGYVISGRESYLEPYTQSRATVTRSLAKLEILIGHNPVQQTNLVEFSTLALQKLAFVEHAIDIRRSEGFVAAQELIMTDEGKVVMDQIRSVVTRMEGEELRLLTARRTKSQIHAGRVQFLCLAFLGLDLLVLCVVLLLLKRVQRLQNLVTVCAWTQRVKFKGKWIRFEEYLRDRFNITTTHGMSEDAANKMKAELEKLNSDTKT